MTECICHRTAIGDRLEFDLYIFSDGQIEISSKRGYVSWMRFKEFDLLKAIEEAKQMRQP